MTTNRPFSALDLKVGFRMLARYPGLTLISTSAIAVGIALGAIYFEAVDKFQNPRLPIAESGRVVSIRIWDAKEVDEENKSLYDFAVWRQQVRTIEHMGADVEFLRNLATDDGRVEPVLGSDITASAFRLMGTPPLLGRTLEDRDENPGEPLVVVLGYTLWTRHFDRDPAVVGRTVTLGASPATIVGVMPEGFAFPQNQNLWAPLRLNTATLEPRTGPSASIFGRLASGASMDEAEAELHLVGARLSAGSPATHQQLSPRVSLYAQPLNEGGQMRMIRNIMYGVNSVFLLLLAIMCTNVATLVFARAATRSWEITVRSALGASRGRIIGQLFGEALVLMGVGATFGLMLAKVGISYGLAMISASARLPFWIDASLSWRTILYAAGLALFGALIVGILPALRVTRVNVQDALRSHAVGQSSLRFGGFWTAVIVAQVAITVAFIPLAAGGVFESNRFNQRAEGIGAQHYLMAGVSMDSENGMDAAAYATRKRSRFEELERRLSAEPGIGGVAFSDRLPVEDQFKYQIEVDTAGGAPSTGIRTSTLVNVSNGFFHAFGTEVAAGRDFAPVDFEPGRSHVMIVNQAFAQHVFGGRNAIGRRIRIVSGEIDSYAGDTWYEIVGVVRNFGWQLPEPWEQSAMYRPASPGAGAGANWRRPTQMAVRVSDPSAFATRLRTIAWEVDPLIRLNDVQPLAKAGDGEAQSNWALTWVAWVVGFVVLILSATGIHALMSFTVSRRTREIGIRVALGADPQRIIAGVFRSAFVQIGAGVLVGSALAALGGLGSTREVLLLLAADFIMLTAGIAACAVPIRRALSIDPTEALRAEA